MQAVKTLKHTFKRTGITKIVILISVILLSFACQKSGRYKWVYYDETHCSDAWEYNLNNEKLKDNITNYLKRKNITVYDVEVFSDRVAETNTSCDSKTGRRFKCKLVKSKVDDIKKEGFYE
jgi:hypothetical protein